MKNSVTSSGDTADLKALSELFNGGDSADANLAVDLKRLWWGVWSARWKILLVVFLSALSLAGACYYFVDLSWRGQSTLIKKQQQDEFRVGRYGLAFKFQPYSFNTLLDTLLLPKTLERVMDRAGISMPNHEFSKLVEVKFRDQSNTFSVGVAWHDPVISAQLSNDLIDVFMQRNRALRQQEIEVNLFNYRQRLDGAKLTTLAFADELLRFDMENNISNIDVQLAVLLESKQSVVVDIRRMEADYLTESRQIDKLEQYINAESKMIVQSSYFVNPMKKNLGQLEWQLAQARGRYTDDNPKVKDLLQRIEQIKVLIASGNDGRSSSETYAFNPVRQTLTVQQYDAKAETLRLKTQLDRLREMVAELDISISGLTKTRKQHDALIYQRESALNLRRDLEQRVDSLTVLLQGDIGDFELIERATPPRVALASGRRVLVVVGVALSIGISVLVVLAREYFQPNLRTVKDVSFLYDGGLIQEFHGPVDTLLDVAQAAEEMTMSYRQFVNDLELDLNQHGNRRIAFVSIDDDVGAAAVVSNAAISLTSKNNRVTLVDLDQRTGIKPISLAGVQAERIVASSEQVLEESQKHLLKDRLKDRRVPLAIVTDGAVADIKTYFQSEANDEWVLFNLAPLWHQEMSFEAIKQVGSVVLVLRSGQSSRNTLESMLERMQLHDIHVSAIILTGVPEPLIADGVMPSLLDDMRAFLRTGSIAIKYQWNKH